jgi:hypothetical protein
VAAPHNEAMVRVIDVAPSTSLDLFAGDLLLFDGLAFKTVTPYRAVDGKRYDFALRPAGMTRAKPLSSNTEGLDSGHHYTAVAMPGDDRVPHLRVVNDPVDPPAAGKARLRIVHAGIDAGAVDIRAAGSSDTLVNNVEYRAITDYRDVSPIDGNIDVVDKTGASKVLATLRTHIEPGRFYTIVISGHADTTPGLEAFLIEDHLSP